MLNSWLPIGFALPNGATVRITLLQGVGWQIVETSFGARTLLAHEQLAARWLDSGLIEPTQVLSFQFGAIRLHLISSKVDYALSPVTDGESPTTVSEAMAFAVAMKATREIDANASFHDAIYVEMFSRLLPTYSLSPAVTDDIVLGYWLTGGANVSVNTGRRFQQMLSWLTADQLLKIVGAAGLGLTANTLDSATATTPNSRFSLPGRKDLEAFFVEHVVDIVEHPGRYRAFGIDFPGAIVLHGPPGTGKTFAIERLVEFLKWPSFQVDASSVGSPYIHETSRKVADIFERAARDAPSVLVIDEMEAFLSDREMGTGHHRVEEVAEFLRRIPEATRRRVLIVGMTNRLEMIDPAVLRRGRFDHVVEVKPASKVEIEELLRKLIATLPVVPDLDVTGLAAQLADRPLSDVTFVVREAGRVAARAGKNRLDLESIQRAIDQTPDPTAPQGRKIGFI